MMTVEASTVKGCWAAQADHMAGEARCHLQRRGWRQRTVGAPAGGGHHVMKYVASDLDSRFCKFMIVHVLS